VRDLVPTLDETFRVSRKNMPNPVFLEYPVDLLYPEPLVRE
jgi:acetolactate synthase-1/2/3 large subunit